MREIGGLGDRFVADHLDILYYSLGTLLAGLYWKWFYNAHTGSKTEPAPITYSSAAEEGHA